MDLPNKTNTFRLAQLLANDIVLQMKYAGYSEDTRALVYDGLVDHLALQTLDTLVEMLSTKERK